MFKIKFILLFLYLFYTLTLSAQEKIKQPDSSKEDHSQMEHHMDSTATKNQQESPRDESNELGSDDHGNPHQLAGGVESPQHQPIPGAVLYSPDQKEGIVTDSNGQFRLKLCQEYKQLIVSAVGYQSDTIGLADFSESMHIHLESTQDMDEVEVTAKSQFVDELSIQFQQVMTEGELNKAPCCNLSEAFATNAAVDVSYSDAATGSKQIKLMGLDGKYVQINRENIPLIRGISVRNGLHHVPGTYLNSISVGLGAGSVVNGYESMSGQVDLDFKKAEVGERLYLNVYQNSAGRSELNLNLRRKISSKLSTALFTHMDSRFWETDRNSDGFMDVPMTRQLSVLNRWKLEAKNVSTQLGFQGHIEDRWGGQLGYGLGEGLNQNQVYGFEQLSRRAEVFGKTGFLFPEKRYKGLGFIYSASLTSLDFTTNTRDYTALQRSIYFNTIYETIIDNSFHNLKTGASFILDDYERSLGTNPLDRREYVPGLYGEYTFSPEAKYSLVTGMRLDYHNLYGLYWTPRLHFKTDVAKESTLRLTAGKGYRTPNAIAENIGLLVSSRSVFFDSDIQQEESWNFGGTWMQGLLGKGSDMDLTASYFYTLFNNALVVDRENPEEVAFYNLGSETSYAHAALVELSQTLNQYVDYRLAYKWYDIRTTIDGTVRRMPMVPQHRAYLNLGLRWPKRNWRADILGRYTGVKRLPDLQGPAAELRDTDVSEDFITLDVQISKELEWGSFYFGGENLTDFRQRNPILSANEPFGDTFDASMAWGPVIGRILFVGIRYKLD